ncbi:MAG: hypothetical protein ACI841_003354 [Planctomycetota bacterium]|jgi:hypothetical protein
MSRGAPVLIIAVVLAGLVAYLATVDSTGNEVDAPARSTDGNSILSHIPLLGQALVSGDDESELARESLQAVAPKVDEARSCSVSLVTADEVAAAGGYLFFLEADQLSGESRSEPPSATLIQMLGTQREAKEVGVVQLPPARKAYGIYGRDCDGRMNTCWLYPSLEATELQLDYGIDVLVEVSDG